MDTYQFKILKKLSGENMIRLILIIAMAISLQSCTDVKEYNLNKYYRDKNSPAALLMGSTYAGVLATYRLC